MNMPKISCLTVTKDRLAQLKQAIHDFSGQTYPNKELIILTDGTDAFCNAVKESINHYPNHAIRFIQLEKKNWTLGALRNQAVAAASGEIICQWDDDDRYHPERLAMQYQAMREADAKACTLNDQLAYLSDAEELYWLDWRNSEENFKGIPGTLMAYKTIMPKYLETGANARMHEDAHLLKQLVEQHAVALLTGKGYLYVYCCHGTNTFSYTHHLVLIVCYAMPIDLFPILNQQLKTALSYYSFSDNLQINWSEAGALFTYHPALEQ